MSQSLNNILATAVGDESDPRGFWLLLLQHIEHMQVRNYAQHTMRIRARYVKHFAQWCNDRDLTQPSMITKPIIESYQRYMFRYRKENGKPLSWCSQSMHIAEVNNFFRYLVKFNHLPFNPASEIELPKKPKSLPKAILSPDEVERILAEPDLTTSFGLRDRAIFELLYSSGIRRGELCNLRMEHVDVERKAIFVNHGKGQKDRYVPVGLRALLWIARYVENGRDKLLLDKTEPTLFLSKDGKPLQPDSLTEMARHYIQSSGIEKPGACHIFRHTMATLMLENGADIRYIQAILGHERLETTQIYTRTSLRKLLEVHEQTHPAERPDDDSETEPESAS